MIQPSLRREGFSAIPSVKWEDVGGLEQLRAEFDRYVVRRIKYPDDYEVSLWFRFFKLHVHSFVSFMVENFHGLFLQHFIILSFYHFIILSLFLILGLWCGSRDWIFVIWSSRLW